MDNLNEINGKDIIENINGKISNYLDIKGDFLDDNYLEVLGDGLSIVRAFSSISNLIMKKRLAYFLKGLSLEDEPSFEQLCRLYDYIDDEKKAEIIADAINKVMSSNSKLSAFLLGLLINRLINSELIITHTQLIYINAMGEFFDSDIKNFMMLSEYIKKNGNQSYDEFVLNGDYYDDFNKWISTQENIDKESIELSIEKGISSQIFTKRVESHLFTDTANYRDMQVDQLEKVEITSAGKLLFENLKYLNDMY